MKYKISREFFPFSHFKPPIGRRFLAIAARFMKTPRWLFKDRDIECLRHRLKSFDGAEIELLMIYPRGLRGGTVCAIRDGEKPLADGQQGGLDRPRAGERLPCLVYFHGGGFVLEAAGYHYKNAVRYARDAGCAVAFAQYRLAPKHPHPIFFEDCYSAVAWVFEKADSLGVDRYRIGLGGDSAGGTLAVGVSMMLRDRAHRMKPLFLMLPYPYLDARNNSDSARRFTDTPMWNSRLSEKIGPMTAADRGRGDFVYYSPLEARSFAYLPFAYIETAEFDCLHDDGVLFAGLLRAEGIEAELNETRGTMHGFDIVRGARATALALDARIAFMKRKFYGEA